MQEMEEQSKTQSLTADLEEDITIEEVLGVVKNLALGKAAGEDELVNEVLKYGGEKMIKILWHIITFCYKKEKIPKEWMEGMIFPIYKGGDKRNPLNYR